MSDRDMLDKMFDFCEEKTKWLYERDLIKNWFNIISWTTLTGFILLMYQKTEAWPLLGIVLVSCVLIFFYAWHTNYEVIKLVTNKSKKLNKLIIFFVLIAGTFIPVAVMFYMFQALGYIIKTGI
tara:strand:- start:175 stop:546 length:372 start_codon:yes stop_codon:yes gene_type:complete